MVGLFETTFQHSSSTPLPSNISIENGIHVLHDFDTVVRLSPDCRGCRPIEPSSQNQPKSTPAQQQQNISHYEVEDDLPFIPKRLWSGGVKYNADFLPTPDGCDITVYAPGGFTSTNRWRILRDSIPEHQSGVSAQKPDESKDLLHMHSEMGNGGWYVQILSDAKCPKAFAGFVKGFLKNSHVQLQKAFIEKLKESPAQTPVLETVGEEEVMEAGEKRPKVGQRRPTLGRRRSSYL